MQQPRARRARAPRTRLGRRRTTACTARQRRVGDDDDGPALGRGAHEARGGDPPAHRLLGRAQVGPVEHEPAVEQERRGVAALGPRLGTRGRHDERRPRVDDCRARRRRPGSRPDTRTGYPGERPAELLGGAPLPHGHRTQPRPRRSGGTRQPPASRPHQRARGQRVPARDAERAVAVHAPRRLAAGLAGKRRDVAAARHLHQHRARSAAPPARSPTPRAGGARCAPPRRGRGRRRTPDVTTRGPRRRSSARGSTTSRAQPDADQRGRLDRARRRPEHERRAGVCRRAARAPRARASRARADRRGESSPSSQSTTSPRSRTGAKTAARVPTTTPT